MPEGFVYRPDLISEAEEAELLGHVRRLAFAPFEFHGYTGKRRTVSFGRRYDFTARTVRDADELPDFLLPLREKAARFAGLAPAALVQTLVIEYDVGAPIGWHRDKPEFGTVIGVSLLAPCTFRLRRKAGGKFERRTLTLAPRSAYILSGPVRDEWEHSIPEVDALRDSVTFRTLREKR